MVQCNRHSRAWRALFAAATIVAMSGSSASLAADQPGRAGKAKPARSRAASAPNKAATATPGSAGMRVAIDPQTGLVINPTLEQRHVLGVEANAELDRSSQGLVIITLPDGTQLCNLEGRFQQYVVARKDDAGNLRTDCVESSAQARRLQAAPVVARPGPVRADESTRVME